MMVGLALDDGAGPVELFDEDETDHLMREGHLGKRYLLVGTSVDGVGETIRTADDKDKISSAVAFLLQPPRILDASVLASVLVEEDDSVGR